MGRRDHRARLARARLAPALLGALIAFAAIACAPGSTRGSEPVATTAVDLPKSYRFAPASVIVPAGATVTWTNSDNFSHNVDLADDQAPPLAMAPGESATHTFSSPGTFAYVCSLHPSDMTGTVVVTAS